MVVILTAESVLVVKVGKRKVAGVELVLLAILVSNGTKFVLARPVMKYVRMSVKNI